ncbi:Acetylornithine deacetylase [Rhodococcus sp. B7740]|nr:Acetylornithine deacetylase [Rhodococcus sp. B7740]
MPDLERLLSFDTTSSNSNLELLRYVDERCQEYGVPTEFIYDESGRKANLLVTVPAADGRTAGGVMFLGHTDTVPIEGQAWTHDPFSPTVHKGRIYARGAADMKAFCACAVAAIPVFAQVTRLSEIPQPRSPKFPTRERTSL